MLGGVGGGVEGAGGGPDVLGQASYHQQVFPPRPQLFAWPMVVHWSLAVEPSAQIVAGRGSFFAHIYFASVATNGVGEEVVGGDVGKGVGLFVGVPLVGGDVGKGVGLDVGRGVGDGPASMHPLVVSKTADTGLEKLLLVSCSITQKNATRYKRGRFVR